MLFTVVTPNYNSGHFLNDTIESVLGNLSNSDVYIVVDGNSTDNSIDIIQSYEHRLTDWISEPDEGYADAIKKGFDQSSSDLMCWVNSSDLLLPNTLDFVREYFLRHPEVDFIYGNDLNIDEDNTIVGCYKANIGNLQHNMLYGGWTPFQDACFWRRSLYDSVGGINTKMQFAADYDLFLRMCLAGDCRYIDKYMSAFRTHKGQISIASSKSYKAERYQIKNSTLDKISNPRVSRFLFAAFFRVKLFLRHRVSYKIQNYVCQEVGKPVSKFG